MGCHAYVHGCVCTGWMGRHRPARPRLPAQMRLHARAHVCMCACVHACVRAYVRACRPACVRARHIGMSATRKRVRSSTYQLSSSSFFNHVCVCARICACAGVWHDRVHAQVRVCPWVDATCACVYVCACACVRSRVRWCNLLARSLARSPQMRPGCGQQPSLGQCRGRTRTCAVTFPYLHAGTQVLMHMTIHMFPFLHAGTKIKHVPWYVSILTWSRHGMHL